MTGLPEVVWTPMGSDNQLPRGFEDACLMAFRASVTDRPALDACQTAWMLAAAPFARSHEVRDHAGADSTETFAETAAGAGASAGQSRHIAMM
jgi:hypothetical protein